MDKDAVPLAATNGVHVRHFYSVALVMLTGCALEIPCAGFEGGGRGWVSVQPPAFLVTETTANFAWFRRGEEFLACPEMTAPRRCSRNWQRFVPVDDGYMLDMVVPCDSARAPGHPVGNRPPARQHQPRGPIL